MMEKIALVTGSSRGLGRAIVLRLADNVSGVAVHYRNERRQALAVVRKIKSKGQKSGCFRADLTKEKEALGLIEKVESYFGRLDIVVNNFGPLQLKPWPDLSAQDWDYIFRANLESAFFCMKASLLGMKKRRWGRIINIGYSRAEQLTAFPTITPYAVAKTGLLILTRTVAASVASSGITVNMVSPGLMEGSLYPPEKKVPAGRLGKFKDVAEAVLFLISEEASYITGTNLIVAGGWRI